jgi:mannose-6-phosphate isomerase-like protein (cupin superfamily)
MPTVITRDQLPRSEIASELVGSDHGLDVTLLFIDAEPGQGPALHRHPYDEVHMVLEGQAIYTVGDEQVEARAGDTVVAHGGEPHKFKVSGTGPFREISIHMSPSFSTEWLE